MNPVERMQLSLTGLSVADALGQTFFGAGAGLESRIEQRLIPPAPWQYTDDTEMALSIVETLYCHGRIDPDALARGFARRFTPWRGYGAGAQRLLFGFQSGADWRIEALQMFAGTGSYGNGAAMRVAPLGAYFADDLEAVKENAILSAQPTHAHPEGIAGAIAVAVAAALAYRVGEGESISSERFLQLIAENVPNGETCSGIKQSVNIPNSRCPTVVARQLGSGYKISAADTVPFALWCAARHLGDYEEAFWATVSGLGDMDTTCAIAGGIVALSARLRGVPAAWISARESLPADFMGDISGADTSRR
ncbi:ADP-ribosylglycohydrolase family protein [Microcoleus sp. FACHB-831]|uniref:ADP-ribosylglycohydrolase family protein n=1 Tax=Microcoleus sp. FACHB-831 TaxID=2692827 RepID=UPI001688BFED|nr:ADP-ribosylglycohydrolase family protein [Microcoleus sp. FACHB-831]MBD1923984.1 ADP-ribosylglycohydrolase family protein [Microcoleus sp. FACHB-831]